MKLTYLILSRREILAAVIAALVVSLAFSISSAIELIFWEMGALDYALLLRTVLGLMLVSVPVTFITAGVLIVTVYLVIRHLGLVNIYTCTFLPFLMLLIIQGALSILQEPSSFSHLRMWGYDLWVNGYIVWENWPALLLYWSEISLYSAIGGMAFWLSLRGLPGLNGGF